MDMVLIWTVCLASPANCEKDYRNNFVVEINPFYLFLANTSKWFKGSYFVALKMSERNHGDFMVPADRCWRAWFISCSFGSLTRLNWIVNVLRYFAAYIVKNQREKDSNLNNEHYIMYDLKLYVGNVWISYACRNDYGSRKVFFSVS